MRYHAIHTTKDAGETRRDIAFEFRKWNRYEHGAVEDYDIPLSMKAGAVGAVVRFSLRGRTIEVACDSQFTYKQNLRAVYFAIEAMRMNEKRGIADTLRKAYLQLEAPRDERDAYEILGVRPDAAMEIIEAAYRALAKSRHPDAGGSVEAMQELNRALERVRADREEPAA